MYQVVFWALKYINITKAGSVELQQTQIGSQVH